MVLILLFQFVYLETIIKTCVQMTAHICIVYVFKIGSVAIVTWKFASKMEVVITFNALEENAFDLFHQ